MKRKIPLSTAKQIASKFLEITSPYFQRHIISGSIRRKSATVGDIEIVAIPNVVHKKQMGMFGNEIDMSSVPIFDFLKDRGDIEELNNGFKYKKLFYRNAQIDLFLQDEDTWGVNLMIRTGSAWFARMMVTKVSQGGFMPDEYRSVGARIFKGDRLLETKEEEGIFKLWKKPFIPPEYREESFFVKRGDKWSYRGKL